MAADSINHLNVESDVQGCAALRAGVATVPIGAACREYPSRTNPQRSSRPPTSSRPVGIARNSGQPGLHMAVAPLNRMSLVKAMWSASGNADEAVLPGVIVPDSHVEFVFHLADPWRMRCANEPGWRPQPSAFVLAQKIAGCSSRSLSRMCREGGRHAMCSPGSPMTSITRCSSSTRMARGFSSTSPTAF